MMTDNKDLKGIQGNTSDKPDESPSHQQTTETRDETSAGEANSSTSDAPRSSTTKTPESGYSCFRLSRNQIELGLGCASVFLSLASLLLAGWALDIARKELDSLKSSITQQTATAVYSAGLQTSTILIENPKITPYFEDLDVFFAKTITCPNSKSNSRSEEDRAEEWRVQRDKAAMQLATEDPLTQAKVWSYAEFLADFLELAFVNKHLLQTNDWKSWWYYICDQYDASAVLREFCQVRGGKEGRKWYSFVDEVNKSDTEREQFLIDYLKGKD